MKIRSSLRKMCEQCKIITRGRKNYVICKGNPRHKQRQGYATLASSSTTVGIISTATTSSTTASLGSLSSLSTGIRSFSVLSSTMPMFASSSVSFSSFYGNDQMISGWLSQATAISTTVSTVMNNDSLSSSSTETNSNTHESMGTGTLATLTDIATDIEDV